MIWTVVLLKCALHYSLLARIVRRKVNLSIWQRGFLPVCDFSTPAWSGRSSTLSSAKFAPWKLNHLKQKSTEVEQAEMNRLWERSTVNLVQF